MQTTFLANTYLHDIAGSFRGEIDKLIIAPMLGFIFLGNYFLGLQIIGILGILPGIVCSYVLPMDASGKSTMETHNEYGNFMPKLYGAMSTLKMQQQAGTKANVPDLLYKLLNDSIDPETRGHLGLIQ